MKEEYEKYLFMCHCEGDIWNLDHRPYTYEEWLELSMPKQGGVLI